MTDIARAVDRALREAGGGRVAGVHMAREFGRDAFQVQFVRGSWLCTATVDAVTGDVTTILDDGLYLPGASSTVGPPAVAECLGFRASWDVAAAPDEPATAYVATDVGVGVVRAGHALVIEDHHITGFGGTRQVTPVPGGVVGTAADGRLFRIDRDGRPCWDTWLPASPYTVAASPDGSRLLVATNAGALELDAHTGAVTGSGTGPVRAATYLPAGDRVLAGHHGTLTVVGPDGSVRWRWEQGEYPERAWVRDGRAYVAGEGGLKEIVVGEGVVCRWSAPPVEPVGGAVIVDGRVFTCAPGLSVDQHDYATAAYVGQVTGLAPQPEAITAIGDDGLLIGHRDGTLSLLHLDD